MSRKKRYFDKDGRKKKGDKPFLSSSELAQLLKEKEEKKESTSCPACKKFKKPGFSLCYKCQEIKNMLYEQRRGNPKSTGLKEQEKMKRRFGPNRKNRKKSRIIDNYILSLDGISPPNVPQYQASVKTILRKLSPLHALADEVKEASEQLQSVFKELEEF